MLPHLNHLPPIPSFSLVRDGDFLDGDDTAEAGDQPIHLLTRVRCQPQPLVLGEIGNQLGRLESPLRRDVTGVLGCVSKCPVTGLSRRRSSRFRD